MNISIIAKCNNERTIDVNGRVSSVGYLSGGTFGTNVRAMVTPANLSYMFISCLGSGGKKEKVEYRSDVHINQLAWLRELCCEGKFFFLFECLCPCVEKRCQHSVGRNGVNLLHDAPEVNKDHIGGHY